MVKYKDQLIKLQFLVIFLIPLTPHIKITNFLQLDDLPVVIFLISTLIPINLKSSIIVNVSFTKGTLVSFTF